MVARASRSAAKAAPAKAPAKAPPAKATKTSPKAPVAKKGAVTKPVKTVAKKPLRPPPPPSALAERKKANGRVKVAAAVWDPTEDDEKGPTPAKKAKAPPAKKPAPKAPEEDKVGDVKHALKQMVTILNECIKKLS
jgi:hypothetical protein